MASTQGGEGEAREWLKGVAWMGDVGEVRVGAGTVAREVGGFPRRAQALARAAGVR